MHGTVWENLVKAPRVDFLTELASDQKHYQSVLGWKVCGGHGDEVGGEPNTDPPVVGHITVSPCESSSLFHPQPAEHRSKEIPSTDLQGVMACPAPLPTRESHTSEWETLSEDWFFLQEEKNQPHILYITLYVIVYNLLIPWWWCPCMEYLVFGFLKTAWNKMYNSQSYLCFCNCRDKSTLLFHPLTSNWFDVYFLRKHGLFSSYNLSKPRFSVTNSTLSYRLCYWFSIYSLRAIKWR